VITRFQNPPAERASAQFSAPALQLLATVVAASLLGVAGEYHSRRWPASWSQPHGASFAVLVLISGRLQRALWQNQSQARTGAVSMAARPGAEAGHATSTWRRASWPANLGRPRAAHLADRGCRGKEGTGSTWQLHRYPPRRRPNPWLKNLQREPATRESCKGQIPCWRRIKNRDAASPTPGKPSRVASCCSKAAACVSRTTRLPTPANRRDGSAMARFSCCHRGNSGQPAGLLRRRIGRQSPHHWSAGASRSGRRSGQDSSGEESAWRPLASCSSCHRWQVICEPLPAAVPGT